MAPDTIETTDLEDTTQTFVAGVQSLDTMEFTANYTSEAYDAAKANERTAGYFELDFGAQGADGIFTWQGEYVVYATGGEVNGVREMVIVVTPSTVITKTA